MSKNLVRIHKVAPQHKATTSSKSLEGKQYLCPEAHGTRPSCCSQTGHRLEKGIGAGDTSSILHCPKTKCLSHKAAHRNPKRTGQKTSCGIKARVPISQSFPRLRCEQLQSSCLFPSSFPPLRTTATCRSPFPLSVPHLRLHDPLPSHRPNLLHQRAPRI